MENRKSGLEEKLGTMKVLSFVAVIIMIGTGISGCFGDDDGNGGNGNGFEEGEITRENTMIYDSIGEPEMLDPASAYDTASGLITQNVYERLVTYEGQDTKTVYPQLATSWEYQEGGTEYTFKLREGVKFSNGNDFTADDVVYSFDRVIKMNQPVSWILSQVLDIGSTIAVDDYNIKMTLKFPYAAFINALAFHACSIVDKETFVKYPDTPGQDNEHWNLNMMGTGPYQLEKWDKGQQIELTRNPHYWKGWDEEKAGYKFNRKVIIRRRDETGVRTMTLKNGDCDLAYIPATMVDTMKNEADLTFYEGQLSYSIIFISLNNKKEPFDNKLVRQAFSYAFDYEDALQHIIFGYGVQGAGPIPLGMLGHNNNVFQYRKDHKKAKELLDEAGYPNGTGFPDIELLYNEGNEVRRKTLELLKQNLEEIGIKSVTVNSLDWATFLSKSRKGELQVSLSGWAPDYNDPDNYAYPLLHTDQHDGSNHAYYSNETVDKWIMEAKKELDSEKRVEIYNKIQDAVVDDAPNIWVYQAKPLRFMRKWVEGHEYNPVLLYDFYALHIVRD